MAFDFENLSPLGANSKAGLTIADRNAPMGWTYGSDVDDIATLTAEGYFDSINKLVGERQFIYCSLTDGNIIVTIESVSRLDQTVDLNADYIQSSTAAEPKFTGASWSGATSGVATLGKHRLYTFTGSVATTFTLPDTHEGTNTNPWYFEIKDQAGVASTLPITVSAVILIDGAASLQITADYGLFRLYANDSGYFTR